MVDLTTVYGGKKIKNPLIAGASPLTHTPEACLKAAQAGFAGVVLKTHSSEEIPELLRTTVGRPVYFMSDWRGVDPWKPKVLKKKDAKGNIKYIKNSPHTLTTVGAGIILSYYLGDKYLDYVKETKDLLGDDTLVIASIVASSMDGWKEQCELINNSEADVVELDLGCPHAPGKNFPGLIPGTVIGVVPEVVEQFTKFAVDNLNIPALVKLPGQQPSPVLSALAAVRGGATGVVFSNSGLVPSLRIDIDTVSVGWDPKYPTWHSGWGPWAVPYVCGNIAKFRLEGIKVELSASGGTYCAEDVIRMIMAGADNVQPVREVMASGYEIVTEWLEQIEEWMEKNSYESIEKLKGIVLDKIVSDQTKLPLSIPQIMGGPEPKETLLVDEKKCIQCEWCVKSCSHFACIMENNVPKFDKTKCELCGLCYSVCPTKAISVVEE